MKKEHFFSKLTNKSPNVDKMERTKEIFQRFDIRLGVKLTELHLKSDVILIADVFEKFIEVSTKKNGVNPFFCVGLPGCTYQCALKFTDITLQTFQGKDLIPLIQNNIREGISPRNGRSLCIIG